MEILTNENFDQKKASGLVLIDFFATWCGPCKMIAPVLEDLDANLENLSVYKVDVDETPDLAGRYGVQSIPNMILFKDGEAVEQIIGFNNKDQLLEKIKPHM